MHTKKIHVAPHIKKFLEYHFGDYYLFSRKDWFGAIVAGVLKKGYRTSLVKHGEAIYPVKFSPDSMERLGKHIEWSNCIYLNLGVDKVFRSMLFNYMDINRKLNKGAARQSMIEYLAEVDVTEHDISFDTLYKDYRRKQKYPKTTRRSVLQQIEKNNTVQLSSTDGIIVLT